METEEKKYVTFINDKGEEQEAEVLMCFEAGEPSKNYIIYTFNERDKNDMIVIYSAILVEDAEHYRLEDIKDDNEWSLVKEVMREVVLDGKEGE